VGGTGSTSKGSPSSRSPKGKYAMNMGKKRAGKQGKEVHRHKRGSRGTTKRPPWSKSPNNLFKIAGYFKKQGKGRTQKKTTWTKIGRKHLEAGTLGKKKKGGSNTIERQRGEIWNEKAPREVYSRKGTKRVGKNRGSNRKSLGGVTR